MLARDACAAGLSGWERLLTVRDPVHAAVLRYTLTRALDEWGERRVRDQTFVASAIERGVVRALAFVLFGKR